MRNYQVLTNLETLENHIKSVKMTVMTDIKGSYNSYLYRYCQPAKYETWEDVVFTNKIQLEVVDHLVILPNA